MSFPPKSSGKIAVENRPRYWGSPDHGVLRTILMV